MSDIFSLQGSISVDNRNAIVGLNEVDNKASSVDRSITSKMGSLATNVGSAFSRVGSVLGAAAVTIGTISTKMYSDFETSVAKVSTLVTDQFAPTINDTLIRLSNETGKSANEIGEAIYQGLSSGVSEKNIEEFTRKMNKLAKGGMTDVATATDLVTTILNSYGMEIEETTNIMDKLVTIQNKGKTTVSELGGVMGRVIPSANALSVNLDNVGSALALATSKGIATNESVTYLNAMLTEMGKSGTKVSDILKTKTGKSFKDLSTEGKSLSDILKIVDESAKQNGLSLTDMFGSAEAGRMALTLLSGEGEEFNKMLQTMEKSTGESDKAFQKMDNTLQSRVDKTVQKLKNTFIKLGEALLPVVEGKIVPAIESFANKLADLDEETINNIAGWVEFAAKLGAFMLVGGKALSMVGSLTTVMSNLGVATTGGTALIGTFGSAIGLLLNPLTLGIAAIGGIGLAIYSNEKAINEGEEQFKKLGTGVGEFEGKLRTTESFISSTFGKTYKIQFSDDFIAATNNVSNEADIITERVRKLQEDIKAIMSDSSLTTQETSTAIRELYDKEIEEQIRYHQTYNFNAENHQRENRASYAAYLQDVLGYDVSTQQDSLEAYETYFNDLQAKTDTNNNKIVEIMTAANSQRRELTETEINEINTLQEENAGYRQNLVKAEGEDIFSLMQKHNLDKKVLYGEDSVNLEESTLKKRQALLDYDAAEESNFAKAKERISSDMSLNNEQKSNFINNIDAKKKEHELFKNAIVGNNEVLIQDGISFSDANSQSMQRFVTDLTTGKINASEFGLTTVSAMAMAINKMAAAGVSSSDLTNAINQIPKQYRADVLALISGKDAVDNLKYAIDSVQSKTVFIKTVTQNVMENYGGGAGFSSYAKGSEGILKRAIGDESFKNTSTVLTGEQGAELVQLPRGSKIKTHRETGNILKGNDNNEGMIVLNVGQGEFMRAIGQIVSKELSKLNRRYKGAY